MDYEKKYKEALETARKINSGERVDASSGWTELEVVFPELRESEDEEIRQQLLWLCGQWEHNPEGRTIPADIDNIRKIRNWLEKQKEQKPAEKSSTLQILKEHLANTPKEQLDAEFEKLKEFTIPKPAEWSEEDKDMLNCCISSIEEAKENRYAYKETDGDTSYDREIAFLKSLRPSWKPSEEQMNYLCAAVDAAIRKHNESVSGYKPARVLKSLYEDLQKLM